MQNLKQIMYGVTDFALMRTENAYFVDRTGLLRELERTRYAMFLRPRRFGKSLLCSILQSYYDVDYAARFDELFGGLEIGQNPTAEHGKYLFIAANHDLAREWNLREQGGTVVLHRLVLVFHGGDVVLAEEVSAETGNLVG